MATAERFHAREDDTVLSAPEALERLYVEHSSRVLSICVSILRDRHEAEDAAQQVFVSALRALCAGRVPREPDAWLATIARHECWARARRRAAMPVRVLPEQSHDDDPAAIAIRRAELVETWDAIAELPSAQRDALLLREVRGLAYDELAEDLRLSHASVRSLLTRARNTLRSRLERGAAVLSGAQWLNVLVRLFADGSTPAASQATRAAAVGIGALALSGGAIVVPALTRHPHAAAPVAASIVRAGTPSTPGPRDAAPAREQAVRVVRGPAPTLERRRRDGSERLGGSRAAGPSREARGGDSHDGSSGGSGQDGTASVSTSTGDDGGSRGGDTGAPATATQSASGDSHGGSSPGSGSNDTPGPSGDPPTTAPSGGSSSDGKGGGDSGSGSSSGSGGATTQPAATATTDGDASGDPSSHGDGSGGASGQSDSGESGASGGGS